MTEDDWIKLGAVRKLCTRCSGTFVTLHPQYRDLCRSCEVAVSRKSVGGVWRTIDDKPDKPDKPITRVK